MNTDTQKHNGSCHCGNVSFSFEHDSEITEGLRCNCSICIRKGAVMSNFVISPDKMQVQVTEKGSLGLYAFGNEVAKHFFCKKCGIYPFHTTFRMPGYYRVNLGCVEGIDSFNVDIEIFDGKSL